MRKFVAIALFTLSTGSLSAAPPESDPKGWNYGGAFRLRVESLRDSFRLVSPQDDLLFFSRLELDARFRGERWQARAELQDSRAWGEETLSPIGTDDVNTLELINLALARHWRLDEAKHIEARFGRMTVNHGSRRLLARNRFRNTSNAFQGATLEYRSPGYRATVMYSYPLQRSPNAFQRGDLRDNQFSWDRAGRDERFWGLMQDLDGRGDKRQLGMYLFGSERGSSPSRPVSPRDLLTAGFRWVGARGTMDWEAEAAYQWGDSRNSALLPGAQLLKHRAWFTHVHIGWQISPDLGLRVAYDQATGDRDPFDERNERFDRLYGARAFELGPSGIFGAAIRSNLRAPALRFVWEPGTDQRWLFSYRRLRLDSATDSLVGSGRRDVSGASGRDVGGQWELRWRWAPKGARFSFETGGAVLDKGAFLDGSESSLGLNPRSMDPTPSRYLFAQWIITF